MMFTNNTDEWLQEVDLWNRRETEDLLATLEQRQSVGMFEFASSDDRGRGYVMAPHTNRVLVLASDAARLALAERLRRSLRGEWDSCLMVYMSTAPATGTVDGSRSRLM
jgi:hypothetical protein